MEEAALELVVLEELVQGVVVAIDLNLAQDRPVTSGHLQHILLWGGLTPDPDPVPETATKNEMTSVDINALHIALFRFLSLSVTWFLCMIVVDSQKFSYLCVPF